MKRLLLCLAFLICHLSLSSVAAQGWPSKYGGVMLQGFYWDSYTDTNWANLESQADEMSQYFDLIWVPNSAYANSLSMNMGYHPVYWFDHKSAFGTEAQLRSMIKTFKEKGTGIIEDVVINHRASVDANWLHFPAETYKDRTYQLTAADICQDDEANDQGYKPTGALDTGEGWGGARDLDHTGANVQKNVQAYEDFLLNDLGYIGFRYDFVKGFAAKYVGMYNKAAGVKYSVGECWDGNKTVVTNWINGTKIDGVIQSAAFDFPMKYYINTAFSNNGSNWSELNKAALSNDPDYARYAVTFVDNHDTGRPGEIPLYANVEAANAFILTMPGTPCLWLSHWKTYKTTLKRLITIRKAVGITNESAIITKEAKTNGYVLMTEGQKGNALLLLGTLTEADLPSGNYKLALEGTNFKMYVSNTVDLSALDNITEDTFTAPSFCVVNEGETCAFFEAPKTWGSIIRCWAWDASNNYTGGNWPGVACQQVGTNNGRKVWKWTYNGTLTSQPTGIIFNDGSNQTADLDFKNGGYYNEAGALQGVVTPASIENVATDSQRAEQHYDLQGRHIEAGSLKSGLYIVNGKKIIVR